MIPGAVADPDMKIVASLPVDADGPVKIGEGISFAPKGEVNADNQRAKTPAERLGLFDESRGQVGKMSGRAVYFGPAAKAVRAIANRGGASHSESCLLRQISGHRVRRGLPEPSTAISPASLPLPATDIPT